MEIFLFGDQTADQYPILRSLAARKDDSIVTSFTERSIAAIREEIEFLPHSRRKRFPNFLHLSDLLENYCQDSRIPELETSLVVICQLAYYINIIEERPQEPVHASTARYIGLCAGAIAAAAVASSSSVNQLSSIGIEAVRIAFRAGTCTGIARDNLVPEEEITKSWSTVVAETSQELAHSALNEHHASNKAPSLDRPYISAVSNDAVTISGAPASIADLFENCKFFRVKKRVPLSIYAPYHAPHLLGNVDVDYILNEKTQLALHGYKSSGVLLSATTGKPHATMSILSLFREVLYEILCKPIMWNLILEETAAEVNKISQHESSRLIEIGATKQIKSLAAAVKGALGKNVSVCFADSTLGGANHKSSRTQDDKIAIVGMAGRFPNAADHEKLWDLLISGLDVHREVPPSRFDAQAHCDPSGKGKNKTHTPYGCFIEEPGLFDPRFFNMSPREAAQTDPMARLGLVTAYEALEMSGFVPNRTPSTKLHRIGTFYGQTSDDWREINAAEDIDTYFITGGVRAFAPGRINYHFKFSGPSYSVDTACSSSLAAIQLACTSLWAGECDTACAGGLNVLTNPDIFAGLSKGQFLSKTGPCKTFDNDADGYCRGDGCGTVILKRYQDAVKDKDNILGCILSAGTNHSAESVSITHPHAPAQEFLYKKVLSEAGIRAQDVSYVEMHGTGTQAGDGIEMTSVTNALAPTYPQRRADQPLYLGAIKANIGHGEAASGINSIIKCLLMLREGKIPPNVGIKGILNQSFPKDLASRNVHIPTKTVPFPRYGTERRKMMLNNFSAAGGNTALVIEEAPSATSPRLPDPRRTQIITVTARSISSLKKNIHNLINYLDVHPGSDLSSLSYTLTARRIQHNYRVAFPVSSVSQFRERLLTHAYENSSPVHSGTSKTIFVFTGQGTQYESIGKQLYQDYAPFRAEIDMLDKIALSQEFPSFLPLILGSDVSLLSPVVVQLGLACIQVALARTWNSWGVKASAVIGHSLGEYAALHVAGVISASDFVKLVGGRARLVTGKCTEFTHSMLAVKGTVEVIKHVLGTEMLEVACINGPQETVLSSSTERVKAVNEILLRNGLKTKLLKVPYAFHSSQLDAVLEPFQRLASSVIYHRPRVPVISPLCSAVIRNNDLINADYLVRHARETVNFQAALQHAHEQNLFDEKTSWLEIGAHPVCLKMVASSLGYSPIAGAALKQGEDPWKTIVTSMANLHLSGVNIDFNEYHRYFNECHELLVLPTYDFDNKVYWLDYHNNWTLTKGESPALIENTQSTARSSTLKTTSCQNIVHEKFDVESAKMVIQSDLTEPKLYAVVCGHMVNNAALCPSSLLADMALTISDYIYTKLRPDGPPVGFNVTRMEVFKPIIAKVPPSPGGQHIQMEATADLTLNKIQLRYYSVSPEGQLIQDHARCLVKLEDTQSWTQSWGMIGYMVSTQVQILMQKLHQGTAHKMLRGMTYKLFGVFVSYGDKFRGMEEVLLDGNELEATASISFQSDYQDGSFFLSPYWIDSLCHIAGFIVNATDLVDSNELVYISHGWSTMRFAAKFRADKKYRSYVRMHTQPNDVRLGDVYIFDGNEIVGVVGGLKFQGMPRKVLNTFLPPGGLDRKRPDNVIEFPQEPPRVVKPFASEMSMSKPLFKIKKQEAPVTSVARALEIIAKETEVDMSELVDDAEFDNLGVDSLMSLSIAAEFREALNFEIPSSLFMDYPTIGEMKKFFAQYNPDAGAEDSDSDGSTEALSSNTNRSQTPVSVPSDMNDDSSNNHHQMSPGTPFGIDQVPLPHDKSSPRPHAKSILLQGNPRVASKILFLFPDGSGSATSYVNIPVLSSSIAVYGFDCPYMKSPEDFKIDFRSVCRLYIEEMQHRQPTGPYYIGGWSAGGVVAYEVAVQLLRDGESINKLLLIDSPCPVALAPLPSELFHYFDEIGLLRNEKGSASPKWLVPHFEATVRALSNYEPPPLVHETTLSAHLIWAKDGVCEKGDIPRPAVAGEEPSAMKWLLDKRTDFKSNGWHQLLGESCMKFDTVEGNHFTMMTKDYAASLGTIMADALLTED